MIREDIYTPNLQKSVKYTYNSIGNLTGIFNYDYTLSDLPSTSLTSKIYYYNPSKPDQLTRINYFVGAICNSTHDYYYDAIGNLSYVENYDTFESESFGWEGRMLISYAVDSAQGYGEIDYTYNDQGIRTSKNVWGTMHTYVLDGDRVLEEKIGLNTIIYYTYDVDGTLISMNYNGNEYFYITNLQGDIIEMVNISGNTVVKYRYDAWGNITYQYGGTLASINPYRYRGYRYDQETNLYYLQSRYYDPEIGRFISRDSTGYLDPMSNQGLNLYAYCGNNPVMFTDSTGTSPEWWNPFTWSNEAKIIAGIVIIAGLAIATIATGGAAGGVAGFMLAGALKGAAIGAVSGGLISGATGGLTSGSWEGFYDGFSTGFMTGAFIGGVTGAASNAFKVGKAASMWDKGTFKSGFQSMKYHYAKHGAGAGNIVNFTNQATNFAVRNASSIAMTQSYSGLQHYWTWAGKVGANGYFTTTGKIITYWLF